MSEGITAKILQKLSEGAMVSAALFMSIIESGYGASRPKLQKNFDKILDGLQRGEEKEEFQRKKHNFHLILSKLKREGMVEKKENGWRITGIGKIKLTKLLGRLPRKTYKKEADSTIKIIIFDIPEKEAKKRTWLRRKLKELGLKMLQKSVWIGKTKFPEEFIEDLRKFGIFQYIDIFAITKSGSIKEIT